jgi:hypothetical protein
MKNIVTTSLRFSFTAVLVAGLAAGTYAQQAVETARQHLIATASKQSLTPADVEASLVSSAYRSPTTGWDHVYFNQAVEGVEVHNRVMSVVVVDGQVRYAVGNYLSGALTTPRLGEFKSAITPLSALQSAAANVGFAPSALEQIQPRTVTQLPNGTVSRQTFSAAALSNDPVEVKLYWLPQEVAEQPDKKRTKLQLIWQVRLYTKDGKNGWNIRVNAMSGAVLEKTDEIISCNFGTPQHTAAPHACTQRPTPEAAYFGMQKGAFAPNQYTVFDYPLEAPTFGSRTVVTSPYTRFVPVGTGPGTTNGWHSDGTTSYTDTRGNNVWAQEDVDNNDTGGSRPSSATLDFDHPYTLGLNTAPANQNAAIVNLFYWNNLIHDVLWKFGFDEPSGNFQANNLGRGGSGNDHVQADAQDGSGTNNANFGTPPDGSSPRMQMYLWNYPTNYLADSDFDNAIIAHEYGHGWSIRLTGGPANVNCLWNAEQGGEGWSDYLGLMLTTNWAGLTPTVASANIPRGIGTYVLGQATSGAGIRPYRYSYDMTNVNAPVTYAKVGDFSFSQPHGIGSIWCTMLWDMTWEIILQDQFIEPNVYDTPTSVSAMRGNVAAFKLVNEGLRLQPCSPSFVDARNAILQADQLLFNGRYRCAIGRAFARRGLGANASTGTSSGDRVVVEDFTPLPGVGLSSPTLTTACTGNVFAYTATTGTSGITFNWTRPVVSGISNASASGGSAVLNETLLSISNVPVTVRYLFTLSPDNCAVNPPAQAVDVVVYPKLQPLVASYTVCQNANVPTNDGLKARQVLKSSAQESITSTSGTYVRASGNNTTTYSPGQSVFFKSLTFVAPVSGPLTLQVVSASLTAGDTDVVLSLYETTFDPASPATNFLRTDDDSGGGLLPLLTHSVVAGTTYVIVVATYYANTTGTFLLQSSQPILEEGISNSVDGLLLASSGTYIRSNSGSTYSPSGVSSYFTMYIITAPQTGMATFRTTAAALSYGGQDTYLSLYQTSFNPNSPATNFLYADDDSGGGVLSRIDYNVTQGATYVLVVGTYSSFITGSFTLQSSMPVFSPGNSIGWFRNPTGGAPLTTGYVFNPVGVPGSGITSTSAVGSTTFYLSRTDVPTCREPVTFVVANCAPTFESATTGLWNVPGTWTCNCIPDDTKPVRILDTHTVTVPDGHTGQAQRLHFIGTGRVNMQGTGKVTVN